THNTPRRRFPFWDRARVASSELTRWHHNQHESVRHDVLLAGWLACFSRHDETSCPVYDRAVLFWSSTPARGRGTAGDSLIVLALRGYGLGCGLPCGLRGRSLVEE